MDVGGGAAQAEDGDFVAGGQASEGARLAWVERDEDTRRGLAEEGGVPAAFGAGGDRRADASEDAGLGEGDG